MNGGSGAVQDLVRLVFVVALYALALCAIVMGSRRAGRDVPAPRGADPSATAASPRRFSVGSPRLDPWPYPTVPGLVAQPDAEALIYLRHVLEALKEKFRTKVASAGSPDAVADALLDMAESGARQCSRAGVFDLGRRFDLLRERLASRQGGMHGSTASEAQAAMEEMKLLLGTIAAIASRRYVA